MTNSGNKTANLVSRRCEGKFLTDLETVIFATAAAGDVSAREIIDAAHQRGIQAKPDTVRRAISRMESRGWVARGHRGRELVARLAPGVGVVAVAGGGSGQTVGQTVLPASGETAETVGQTVWQAPPPPAAIMEEINSLRRLVAALVARMESLAAVAQTSAAVTDESRATINETRELLNWLRRMLRANDKAERGRGAESEQAPTSATAATTAPASGRKSKVGPGSSAPPEPARAPATVDAATRGQDSMAPGTAGP